MIYYKTIYLICIILCLMGYADSGITKEENASWCKKNLRQDFDYPVGTMKSDILAFPRRAFRNKIMDKFQTNHGLSYLLKIVEKAATGLTESPRQFCDRTTGAHAEFSSTLCMEQLHEVYHIANENDALPVIRWTYVNKTESDIPKTFDVTNKDDEVVQFKHFAYAYFNHMASHLDVYVSLPWPFTFCQRREPHHRERDQHHINNSDENPGESSRGEMTVRQLQKARSNKRTRNNSDPDIIPSDN